MSDEHDSVGSAGEGTDSETAGNAHGRTAVVTRPSRPSGKRSRRVAVDTADDADTDSSTETQEDSSDTKSTESKSVAKPAKKKTSGPSRNPIAFVVQFLKEVVDELRKVIWPSRKQMVSYTMVVLAFLVFMVTLIGLVDFGLARLVMLVFG